MHCHSCDAPLADDARFCSACGARLSTPGASADPLRAAIESAAGSQYEIMRLLGRGGMGAVYLGREKALDRLVAIKVLPPDKGEASDSRERFRREARTAARLTHPNITPLHAFGDAGGVMYFVMGYVRGESLGARLRREGKLPAEDVRHILSEIAEALDYAHRQGVIHRDIKPDNILLDDEGGHPMLTDFGVAKARGTGVTLTEKGSILGTPAFMCPEQINARELDGRSDLYSLGVTGYMMLSGRLPFEGEVRDVLLKHLTHEPPPLSSLAPDAPEDLRAAITRCLAKDPGARWPDGRSLHEALREAGEEVPEALDSARFVGMSLGFTTLAAIFLTLFDRLWSGQVGYLTSFAERMAQVFSGLCLAWLIALGWRARTKGISWGRTLYAAFRKPMWWPFWFPQPLRPPGDVWSRLPHGIRRLRTAVAVAIAFCVGIALPIMYLWTTPAGAEKWGVYAFMDRLADDFLFPLLSLTVVALMCGLAYHFTGLTRKGLTEQEATRVVIGATAQTTFWRKPHIAALLLPPETGRLPEPKLPRDYLQAIARIAPALSGSAREPGGLALAAAQRLVAVLEGLDSELTRLAPSVNPDEIARLEQKHKALGAVDGGDSAEGREMIELLARQIAILKRMAARHESQSELRARLLTLLHDLWAQVSGLANERAGMLSSCESSTEHLRAICAEIERVAPAYETDGETADGHLADDRSTRQS